MEIELYKTVTNKIPFSRFMGIRTKTNGKDGTYKISEFVVRFGTYEPITETLSAKAFDPYGYQTIAKHTRTKVLKSTGELVTYTGLFKVIDNGQKIKSWYYKNDNEISKEDFETINKPKANQVVEWFSKRVEDVIAIKYSGKWYGLD